LIFSPKLCSFSLTAAHRCSFFDRHCPLWTVEVPFLWTLRVVSFFLDTEPSFQFFPPRLLAGVQNQRSAFCLAPFLHTLLVLAIFFLLPLFRRRQPLPQMVSLPNRHGMREFPPLSPFPLGTLCIGFLLTPRERMSPSNAVVDRVIRCVEVIFFRIFP